MPEELRPYDPTLRDRLRWGLTDLLTRLGASQGTAHRYGDQLVGSPSSHGIAAADFVPGLGNVLAADEGKRSYDRGDYLGAGLNAIAALPVLPVPAAKSIGAAYREVARNADEAKRLGELFGGYDLPYNLGDVVSTPARFKDKLRDGLERLRNPGEGIFADILRTSPDEIADLASEWAKYSSDTLREFRPQSPRAVMSPENIARAEAQGYDTSRMFYHGSPFAFKNFDTAMLDPKDRAVFATLRPDIAGKYAGGNMSSTVRARLRDGAPEANIFPFLVAPKSPAVEDYAEWVGKSEGTRFKDLLDEHRAAGTDFLEIRNLQDIGGPQSQFLVFDPGIMRSPWSRFDPARKGENDILAGIGPLGILGGGAALSAPMWQDRQQ